jgi:hypothetical protein
MTREEVTARVNGLAPNFLEGLAPGELAEILAAATLRVRAKSVVAREGHSADEIFLLDRQALVSQFWDSRSANYCWSQHGLQLAANQDMSLPDYARLSGDLNTAMFDALIGCFDSKYHFVFWRADYRDTDRRQRSEPKYGRRSQLDAADHRPPTPVRCYTSSLRSLRV